MAGAGYKLFAAGDVLSASDVNTYMMQQTVMVFANSTARTTALSSVLAEGMVSYLKDTNVLEVYDGSAWVGATGDITGLTAGTGVSITSATGPVPTVGIDTAVVPQLGAANTFTGGVQQITTASAATKGLIVKATTSQTANLQEWQDSSGTAASFIDNGGGGRFTRLSVNTGLSGSFGTFIVSRPTEVGLAVRGAASQTANLQEWQNSAGTAVAKVESNGNFTTGSLTLGSSGLIIDASSSAPYFAFGSNTITLNTRNAAYKGLVIKGTASQTANLTEWQDSSGGVVAKIDSVGYFGTRGMFGLNNRFSFEEAFGGAFAMIQRSTSTVTNPGSDKARIYIVSGTNAGTLKLVVRAGASGAETTILDNIPQ